MAASFTLQDVLVWARTKPATGTYNYMDNQNCALCQFLRDTHRAVDPHVNPYTWRNGVFGERQDYPYEANVAVQAETFGEIVCRLEAIIAAGATGDDAILAACGLLKPVPVAPKSQWLDPESYLCSEMEAA